MPTNIKVYPKSKNDFNHSELIIYRTIIVYNVAMFVKQSINHIKYQLHNDMHLRRIN